MKTPIEGTEAMNAIKAVVRQPSGFSDVPARETEVSVVGFVNGSTPDRSTRHGNHEGIHAVCVTESGGFGAYPLHQLRAISETPT